MVHLRVAGYLKHASFPVNVASCVALILGDSVGFERDDLLRPRGYFHRGPRRPLMPRKTAEIYPTFSRNDFPVWH